MHLIVPFAAAASEAGRAALSSLRLPNLERVLREFAPVERDEGDELSLTPPHERAVARALGLAGPDGALPFAAHEAHAAGIATGDLAWGRITPVHWHVGTDQVSLTDPAALALDEATSRALFDAVHPLFESEGVLLLWQAPSAWLAAHESLRELPTASLDRVIGRNVDRWLPQGVPLMRRLQMEVQMLLYTHPANEAREAAGALPVNSFWLSHCGAHQPARAAPDLRIDERLRAPALAEDWPAWAAAWRALDADLPASLAALTLAGERHTVRLEPRARGLWQRMTASWQGARAADLLHTL
jgi:hypothetical protein